MLVIFLTLYRDQPSVTQRIILSFVLLQIFSMCRKECMYLTQISYLNIIFSQSQAKVRRSQSIYEKQTRQFANTSENRNERPDTLRFISPNFRVHQGDTKAPSVITGSSLQGVYRGHPAWSLSADFAQERQRCLRTQLT